MPTAAPKTALDAPVLRNVLLVDGPHAGEIINVDPTATAFSFSDLAPIDVTVGTEAELWRYVKITYTFHEATILGLAMVIGWCSDEPPEQTDLAKQLLHPNAWKASIPPKPPKD